MTEEQGQYEYTMFAFDILILRFIDLCQQDLLLNFYDS